jgi:hypothetical protein
VHWQTSTHSDARKLPIVIGSNGSTAELLEGWETAARESKQCGKTMLLALTLASCAARAEEWVSLGSFAGGQNYAGAMGRESQRERCHIEF